MHEIDPSKLNLSAIYKLMIGGIVPRPIAFVSTCDPAGVGNLSPFSYFNGVASNPPSIMFAIAQKPDGSNKDTLNNILQTKEFVVNTVSEWMATPVNDSAAPFPASVDELTEVGLTALPSKLITPVRVKESPIQMECRLYNTMVVGDGTAGSSTIIVGEIVWLHIAKEVYQDGKILLDALKPLSRLAGKSYGLTTDSFELDRAKK